MEVELSTERIIIRLRRAARGLHRRVAMRASPHDTFADRTYASACEDGARRLEQLVALLPDRPSAAANLRRAHKLVADVAQVQVGTPLAGVLVGLMAALRNAEQQLGEDTVP